MQTTRRRLTCLSLFAIALVTALPTRAQHGTSGYVSVPMDPNTNLLLDLQMAEFDLPGRAGVWQTLSPRFEWAPVAWLSLAVRPTIARIDYDTGESVTGLSDSELSVKARVLRFARFHTSLSVGTSFEVPTGDADTGTGNDHVSLFPFANLMVMPSKTLMLHAMLGDRVVLSGASEHAAHLAHGHAHGSVIMPHSEHELALHTGARLTVEPFRIGPALELMQVFSSGSDTYLTAQLELAFVPRRDLQLALALDLPLLDEPRYAWRARMMTAWLW